MASVTLTLKSSSKRRKIFFAAFVLLAMVVVPVVFAWRFSPKESVERVDFICRLDNHNTTFTVSVAVNLDDGMDSSEAITVADKVFQHQMTNAIYIVKSAEADANGVWTVKLSWELVLNGELPESLSHFFDVVINPSNREVSYTRCY